MGDGTAYIAVAIALTHNFTRPHEMRHPGEGRADGSQETKSVSRDILLLLFSYSALDGVTLAPSKGIIKRFGGREKRVARVLGKSVLIYSAQRQQR